MHKQFDNKKPSVTGQTALTEMAKLFDDLATTLEKKYWKSPWPRECEMALNNMEVALFYAQKAALHRPEYKQ